MYMVRKIKEVSIMAEIAILGFGTVGSGVFETIYKNQHSIDKRASQPIRVKYVLDVREISDPRVKNKLTNDFSDILNDNDVKIVVETLGGLEPSYDYVKKCLLRGKSCITSNKELVATHGAELLQLAREKNINFLFEASVGGGIPIIRPLNQSLTADEIYEINGILNGTTNYILTKMIKEDKNFSEALKEAQALGYAERDPSMDVNGSDTCRKIAILLSLALGKQVDYEEIYTEGIADIDDIDIKYIKNMDCTIKLLAEAKVIDKGIYARVAPVIIESTHTMYAVNDVFNAIVVKGEVLDEVMFYGKGAGKFPTASAVVADVIDAAKHLNMNIMQFWSMEKLSILTIDKIPARKLVRVAYKDKHRLMEYIKKAFGVDLFYEIEDAPGEFAFITQVDTEKAIDDKIDVLKERPELLAIKKVIRYTA